MAMDGLSMAAVATELSSLKGCKIEKIYQPERDELLIYVRAGKETKTLLICAAADNCRIQLTQTQPGNPQEPPMFCMLLRKRLIGGRIQSISQPDMDRIIELSVLSRSEVGGDECSLRLIAEIMGKHSNVILVDEQGTVLDSIKHVGYSLSSVRPVMPGMKYSPPPAQQKLDPRAASIVDFLKALEKPGRADRLLADAFFGLSPATAAELCLALTGGAADKYVSDERGRENLAGLLHNFFQQVKAEAFDPTLVVNDFGEPVGVYPFKPWAPEANTRAMGSMCEALDSYYGLRDAKESLLRKSHSIQKILQNNIERCHKTIAACDEALAGEAALNELKLAGELLLANLHSVKKGAKAAMLANYYKEPPEAVEIELDERLTAAENAQKYFKKYQKAKAAREIAGERRQQAFEELMYLEGQLDNIEKCATPGDFDEIKDELAALGYVKRTHRSKASQKAQPSKPMHFVSDDGIDIYVGKNNRQNDMLTLKFADGEDMWLHTKDIPGSHVIVKHGGELPAKTLWQAAMLAAYYSRARHSAQVPVDYTQRKHVKKPSGAKPGMVIYTTNRTLYITPDEPAVKRIRQIQE